MELYAKKECISLCINYTRKSYLKKNLKKRSRKKKEKEKEKRKREEGKRRRRRRKRKKISI